MSTIKITIENKEFEAQEKTFKTGNTGYGLYGKIEIKGIRYQISMNIIKLK